MFNEKGGNPRRRILLIAQKFRDAGATGPERAMSAQELGLPPRFEQAIKRRLGQSGIFVEVGGKYYLNEARLAQMGLPGVGGGGRMRGRESARNNMLTFRMIRLTVGVVTLLLIVANVFFIRNPEVWFVIGALLVITMVISILQIFYLSRMRRVRNFGPFQ